MGRHFLLALVFKVLGPYVALWSLFPWYTGASYWTAHVYAAWFAIIGFAADWFLVPRIGNLWGIVLDVGIAIVLAWVLVPKTIPMTGWFWLLASVALIEYVYHYLVIRRRQLTPQR